MLITENFNNTTMKANEKQFKSFCKCILRRKDKGGNAISYVNNWLEKFEITKEQKNIVKHLLESETIRFQDGTKRHIYFINGVVHCVETGRSKELSGKTFKAFYYFIAEVKGDISLEKFGTIKNQ